MRAATEAKETLPGRSRRKTSLYLSPLNDKLAAEGFEMTVAA
jgi:hypothetical protein